MSRRAVVAIVCCACLAVATIGYAASFTLTTKKLGAASVTTPIMFPDQVITTNVGPNVGKMEKNDTITFVWSQVVDQTTVCSGWANSTSTHTTNIDWVVQDNAGATGDDVMTPGNAPATCAAGLHVGSVDLGSSGYVTNGDATFAKSPTTITVGTSTTSLVVKIPGAPAGGKVGPVVTTGSAAVWTPDSTVTDLSGRNCGSNLAKTSATTQF